MIDLYMYLNKLLCARAVFKVHGLVAVSRCYAVMPSSLPLTGHPFISSREIRPVGLHFFSPMETYLTGLPFISPR